MIQAHAYWRRKGLITDLLFWNEDVSGYRQDLTDELVRQTSLGPDPQLIDRPGGVFVRRLDQIPEEDRVLMQTLARVILADRDGPLAEQVERVRWTDPQIPRLVPSVPPVGRRRRPRSRSTGRPSTTTTGSAASRRTGAST